MRKENNIEVRLSTLYSLLSTKGLTLIEVMVVVAILAIITSTLFSVFQGSLLSHRRGTNKALIYSEARAALDMMSREIEKAMVDERIPIYCWGDDGGGDAPDTFLFVAPLNANNENPSGYRGDLCEVGYRLQGRTLHRHYVSQATNFDLSPPYNWQPLIENVSDLQFKYFNGQSWISNEDWGPDTSLPQAVKITLVLKYEIERDEVRHDTFITVVNIPGSGQ